MDNEEKLMVCAYLAEEVRALALLATELKLSKEDILVSEPAWKIPSYLAHQYDEAATSLEAGPFPKRA
jgi:hypothetical protein